MYNYFRQIKRAQRLSGSSGTGHLTKTVIDNHVTRLTNLGQRLKQYRATDLPDSRALSMSRRPSSHCLQIQHQGPPNVESRTGIPPTRIELATFALGKRRATVTPRRLEGGPSMPALGYCGGSISSSMMCDDRRFPIALCRLMCTKNKNPSHTSVHVCHTRRAPHLTRYKCLPPLTRIPRSLLGRFPASA